MRFAAVSVVTAILATSAAASPTARRNDMAVAQVQSRDLASDVGAIVSGAGSGVSADDLEHDLESLLGDLVVKIEAALKTRLADFLLGLITKGIPPKVLEAIGEALGLLKLGTPIELINAFLSAATDGLFKDINELFGIDDITKVL